MGFEMNITAERFYWFDEPKPRIKGVPKGYEVKSVICNVVSWSRAYAIHDWIKRNIGEHSQFDRGCVVDHDLIRILRALCREIKKDPERAMELLPAPKGEYYDSYYFFNIDQTVSQLGRALFAFPEDKWTFIYRAC